MKDKKYELTDETIKLYGHTLHRIKALKKLSYVKKGDMGGFVESEDNLSQEGDCWIFNNAKVYGNAKVFGAARVYAHAQVHGNAKVFDNAEICENAKVDGNAQVFSYATIHGSAQVYDNAKVFNYALVYGYAKVHENAQVYDHATVGGNAKVCGNAEIWDIADVSGNAEICGDAQVYSVFDYMTLINNWEGIRYITWTRSNDMWKEGLFYGTGKELIEKAYLDGEKSKKNYELTVEYVKKLNLV